VRRAVTITYPAMVAPNLPIPVSDDRIAAFCRKWRVREFSLFGSVLRADFSPASDVDVLLVFEEGASPELEASLDMRDELAAMFGRDVDVVEKRLLKNPFRRHHILTNRRVLYAA
jgi:predicted nucleotidyltransferase